MAMELRLPQRGRRCDGREELPYEQLQPVESKLFSLFFNPWDKKFCLRINITFTFSMFMFENAHLAHSHADTEDGVGSQLVLVVGAVQAQLKETKLVSLTFSHLRQNLP